MSDTETTGADTTGTLNHVEEVKRASDGLRGTLRHAVVDDTRHFADDNVTVLKFHGVYQQDDRDQRVKRGEPREKAWQMMIRLTIPGGKLTADQYLALDDLADSLGNGTLRLTTRQSIQYHGVPKGNLKTLIARVNEAALSTLAACGDVSRNVMAACAPLRDGVYDTVQLVAEGIARELKPRTGAYVEIWLDGERVSDTRDDEPVYGESYLPRKFKVGVGTDRDNSIDLFSYDCSVQAITGGPGGAPIRGWNLLAGGGFGMTHQQAATFARLATPIAFIAPEHAVAAVRAVCEVYRDEGHRGNRKAARLKYLLESWGVDRFREVLSARVPFELVPPVEVPPAPQLDYHGVHEQGDGRRFVGLFVQNGRIADRGDVRLRRGLREVIAALRPGIRLTPMQSLLLTDLSSREVERAYEILATHGVQARPTPAPALRHSMACPAMPTCGLALADAERALPAVVAALDERLAQLGLGDAPIVVRMTGCPNGCARPYSADIGFVGRRPGVYHVFVGGGIHGNRLADLFAADVKLEKIAETLEPLLTGWAAGRAAGETLGDWYQRAMGTRPPRRLLTGRELPTLSAFLERPVS
ncbi:MAG: NADPH-dependent assimilatory sulfite reductase hemoprotein subunit [Gemmatimonadaceae bacterium]